VRPSGRALRPLLPFVLIALGGCRFAGELVGAAAGGATAAATANPLVGVTVGIAVNSAVDAATNYVTRKRQQAEQDAIASEVATWQWAIASHGGSDTTFRSAMNMARSR
jgi:hypothetical protein